MLNSAKVPVKRLTVDLDAKDHRYLKQLAAEKGSTMSELVIVLLRQAGMLPQKIEGEAR